MKKASEGSEIKKTRRSIYYIPNQLNVNIHET